MSRRERQFRSLEQLEREFRASFIVELEKTAAHDTIWAYVTREPIAYQAHAWFRSGQQTHLLEQVEAIEKLRRSLGEPLTGTLCDEYRTFCSALLEPRDENTLGPRRLAQQLLARLLAE